MKNKLLSFPIHLLLLTVFLVALSTQVKSQCSASIASDNLVVCSGSSVSIPVTLTGTAPFTLSYQVNGVAVLPLDIPSSNFNLELTNITQIMVVQIQSVADATGCQSTGSGVVIIQVFPPITVTPNITKVSCVTGNDGAIEVTPSGGTSPYAYAWSDGVTTGPTISNLDVGTYTVTVTDANGCSKAFPITLEYLLPFVSYTVTPAACSVSNGAIDVQLLSPTSYNTWSNGANTEDLVDIPGGVYTLITTEAASGCTLQKVITVPEIGPSVSSTVAANSTCGTQGTGKVGAAAVNGGTPPYSYLWSTGDTIPVLNNVLAGTYLLTITDAVGCTRTLSATIQSYSNTVLSAVVQQSTCNSADGAIDLTINGDEGPYEILWSNGSTSEDLSGISSGTYTVTVTSAGGCTRTLSRTLAPFSVTSTSSIVNCLHNFNLSVTGGTGPYMFEWSSGQNTQNVTNLPPGNYTVTITDALGCSYIHHINAVNPISLTATISENTSACSGGLTAQILGQPAFTTSFLWSTGSTTQLLTNIPTGEYTVTATAASGCTATATYTTLQPLTNALLELNSQVNPNLCDGSLDGSIELFVSGANPPFAYLWSDGSTTETITNLPAGTYWVTITDSNGCTATRAEDMTQPQPLTASWQINAGNCSGELSSITLVPFGGTPPYFYIWRDGSNNIISTSQNPGSLTGGTYSVTITDLHGCSYTSPFIVIQPPVFSVTVEPLSAQCNSASLTINITGGTAPFEYEWIGPNGFLVHTIGPNLEVPESGIYNVIVTDANGCTAQDNIQVNLSGGTCGYLRGRVVKDEIEDCVADLNEPGLAGWLVRAESPTDTFYGVTDLQGYYLVGVPVGTYTMTVLPPNALWEACPSGPAVTVDMSDDTIPGGDLAVKSLYLCPSLSVSLGSGVLRRCMAGSYFFNYCNEGTTDAQDAYILVTLDPFLLPGFSNRPYTNLGNSMLRFELGSLEVGECGSFYLSVEVSCDAVLGQTHCTEAHIYPDGNCVPGNSSWSGASLRVTSQCNNDSVRFTIKNIGIGNMQSALDYIVVEDAVMLMQAGFQLNSGDSTSVVLPANGSTWRVEVPQEPFHPGLSAPALSVEGCSNTTSFSTGFVTQFPNNEEDPWVDIDCRQNVGSYDPNDKQGFPIGYGTEHYIRPGIELEYEIRFQNTGTDTAFTVRIADTLSLWLDPATIRPGASSHPYHFNMTGPGFVEFLFDNILLPDSTVNFEGSNGYVKFKIYPRSDAPLETLIENNAAIYFDFNEPVITNTTRHRLGENFLTVGLWQPQRPEYQVLVSPNPFSETAVMEVKGLTSSAPIHLQVMDLQGRLVHDETVAGPVFSLKKGGLPTGMYLFKLDQKGVMIGSGKLIVN